MNHSIDNSINHPIDDDSQLNHKVFYCRTRIQQHDDDDSEERQVEHKAPEVHVNAAGERRREHRIADATRRSEPRREMEEEALVQRVADVLRGAVLK